MHCVGGAFGYPQKKGILELRYNVWSVVKNEGTDYRA